MTSSTTPVDHIRTGPEGEPIDNCAAGLCLCAVFQHDYEAPDAVKRMRRIFNAAAVDDADRLEAARDVLRRYDQKRGRR